MASTTITPTRMVLKQLKGRLKTARRGHKLMKDKRDELMRQFMDIVRLNKELRTRVEEGLTAAFASFQVASAIMSPEMMERVYRERVNIRGYNVDDLLKGLAALGHADSMFLLGKMSLSRYSGRMSPDTLYWYRRAAEHGHREAIASLRRNGQEFPPV